MRRQKDLLCYKPKQGKKGLQTCEEGVVHPSESHGLGDEVFVNAVLAALAAETALLDTAESVAYLAFFFSIQLTCRKAILTARQGQR